MDLKKQSSIESSLVFEYSIDDIDETGTRQLHDVVLQLVLRRALVYDSMQERKSHP
jgi:hypothetical protein